MVVLSEASYEAQKGVLDQTVAITWVENVESDAGQVLGQALRLMSEPVDLVPYENCDLFLAWFNENLEAAPDHFVTMQDALDSFNEFATRRGNSKISQRYFVNSLKGHSVYRNNKIEYHLQKRLGKLGLIHSAFTPSDGSPSRKATDRETCFIGMKFQ